MPVEIRELVIQAQVRDHADPATQPVIQTQSSNNASTESNDTGGTDDGVPDPEWVNMIVEKCMIRMQEWLTEKSMR